MENIRPATLNDAAAIAEIYRLYVVKTPISFEVEAPSELEMRDRIQEITKKFPWLVFESGGTICGYAYASAFRSRQAYEWSVESAVYVRAGQHGKGIGKKLYQALFPQLKNQGAVNVIAGITLPNEASVALHESFGFTQVAQLKDIGFKLGKWWDVGYWQLQLQKPDAPRPLKNPNM